MNQIIAKSNTKYVDRDVLKTLARISDNQASHNAAKEVVISGKQLSDISHAVSAVNMFEGHTARHLAKMAKLDKHMLSRRLPDALKRGLVRREDSEIGWLWYSASKKEGEL